MYRRDRLKIKALRTGNASDWSNFKKLRNEVNNSIKKVKKSIINQSIINQFNRNRRGFQ